MALRSRPQPVAPRSRGLTFSRLVLAAALLCGDPGSGAAAPRLANVGDARIVANARTGKEWLSNGLDYAGTRFSRLKGIDAANVGKLGLAWAYDLESTRGVEATPVVVDGVMYVTAPWSVVHAIDARTGKGRWVYDPQVPREAGFKACCDVVNRGVAVYGGKVFVGSLDGRLIAIDAATGQRVWEKDTRTDPGRKITITSAPYAAKGLVVVGNGGGEYGVRGYVTAYEAETGALRWRWFVTPGDPSKPFEDESQALAALTWDPSTRYWENGGGGNVWHSMSIDPELGLLYFGTGQPGPWARSKRGPGDSLYTASVVALHLDTGKYAWHYQQNPADNSDFDSCQDVILADLKIDGRARKVLLHAPKNGFFYVLDRTCGQFISAKAFVPQTWAAGFDPNGRPIETRERTASNGKPFDAVPGPFGGHNWQSMSYSPATGLAYFPAQHVPIVLSTDDDWTGQDSYKSTGPMQPMGGIGWNLAMQVNARPPAQKPFGRLVAWDPVRQKEAWSVDQGVPWNGGTLVTAGNLVFQGTADAQFRAFDARNGKQLWATPVGSGVIAAPMTYEVDGKQYVSIAVGWGGVYGQSARHSDLRTRGTVYTYVLGGSSKTPPFERYALGPLISGVTYDPKDVQAGAALYVSHCVFCHGVPGVDKGGNISNLGYVDKSLIQNLETALFERPFAAEGMPDYRGKLTASDVAKLKAFIQGVADTVRPK